MITTSVSDGGMWLPERKRLSSFSLDAVALAALFLQTTELYRPLGYMLGFTSSREVNVAFLGVFAFYLTARHRSLLKPGAGLALSWAFALVVAPTVMMCLQFLDGSVSYERIQYWTLFSLLFASMMLVAAVLWERTGPYLSVPYYLFCLLATWIGFGVNWVNYGFLREVMSFSSNDLALSTSFDRILGFYQWPNDAAFALVLITAALVCSPKFVNSPTLVQIAVLISCFLGVVLTGSRTSLLLLVVTIPWYFKNILRRYRFGVGTEFRRRARSVALIPLILISIFIVVTLLAFSSENEATKSVTSRIQSIGDVLNNGSDTSTENRITILSYYISDLMQSPLLGRGPDFATNQEKLGRYINVSQNAWVEWAILFGIPFAGLMAFMLIYTYRTAKRTLTDEPMLLSYARLLLTLIALVTLSMVTPFWNRATVCALGILLGTIMHSANTLQAEHKDSEQSSI